MIDNNLKKVCPEEQLARYIFSKSHFSVKNKTIKSAAFLPAPDGDTSVFRISNLTENEKWDIGNDVAQKRDRSLYGRADISACHVLDNKLKIVPDNQPRLHANITGWPEEKSKLKLVAVELAKKAQLYLQS